MIPFCIYAMKVIVISGCLFGYYYLALRNERFHEWNRYYLIMSALISLVLPFVRWSRLFSGYSSSRRIYVAELQSFTVHASGVHTSAFTWTWMTWTALFYALITVLLLGGIIAGMLKICRCIRKGEKQKFPVFTLVRNQKIESPFSFFRFIFWNDLLSIESREGDHIFRHELAHVQEKHSVDKLLMETILAVFWINPFFHLIRKELHIIHEFIADRRACNMSGAADLNYFSPQEYATLLVKQCLRNNNPAIANHFFQKQLTRRVRMLVRNNKPHFTYIKRVMAAPLTFAVVLFFIFLQSEAKTNPVSSAKIMSPAIQKAASVLNALRTEGKATRITGADFIKPGPPAFKDPNIRHLNDSHAVDLADAGTKAKVFKFVEQMPTFRGGEDALMAYLSRHIHYPAIAREDDIQGTVVVQFIVNPDGHLSDVITVGRRLGGGLEKEAVRVVNGMTGWIAGRQDGQKVSVQYSLPVRFVLQNEVEENSSDNILKMPRPSPPSPTPPANKNPAARKVYMFVQQMPTFPGDNNAVMKYLQEHIHYPRVARENGIQGTVVVRFIVNPDGHLSDITTVGKQLGGGLEEESIRVVKGMPDWIAGKQNGVPVAVQYNLPIRFVLQ